MNKYIKILTILAVVAFAGSAIAQNATVKIIVKNRTTGTAGKVDKLSLIQYNNGQMDVTKSTTNVNGEFVFKDVPPAQFPYLVQGTYNGGNYVSNISVPAGNEYVAELNTYDPTSDADVIKVKQEQLVYRLAGTELNVVKQFVVTNTSKNKTYVNPKGTMKFYVPGQARSIAFVSVNAGVVPLKVEAIKTSEGGVWATDYAIPPGDLQIQVSWSIPYIGDQVIVKEKFLYDIPLFLLYSTPVTMNVGGSGLVADAAGAIEGFKLSKMVDAKAGSEVNVSISGGAAVLDPNDEHAGHDHAPIDETKVYWRHNDITSARWAFIIVGGILLAMGTIFSRNKKSMSEKPDVKVSKKLLSKKNHLLGELAGLDDAFSKKDIQESDYKRKRTDLKKQLVELFKKIENPA